MRDATVQSTVHVRVRRLPQVTKAGIAMKEWQQPPKQILLQHCQSNKRRNPIFHSVRSPAGKHRSVHSHCCRGRGVLSDRLLAAMLRTLPGSEWCCLTRKRARRT